jgi:putative ABC transport system substrate-binding protein
MLGLVIFAAALAVEAQQGERVYRLAVLRPGPPQPHLVKALVDGLRELGYVEGRNLVIEYRSAEGRVERFPELAAELVRLGPDIIIPLSTAAALAAKQATTTIPIVMVSPGRTRGESGATGRKPHGTHPGDHSGDIGQAAPAPDGDRPAASARRRARQSHLCAERGTLD